MGCIKRDDDGLEVTPMQPPTLMYPFLILWNVNERLKCCRKADEQEASVFDMNQAIDLGSGNCCLNWCAAR